MVLIRILLYFQCDPYVMLLYFQFVKSLEQKRDPYYQNQSLASSGKHVRAINIP